MPDPTVDAFIAVGSNVEPEENIPAALEHLAARLPVIATSTFYRTAPIGRTGQPTFLNGVWRVRTDLPPRTLKFDVLRGIEAQLGRVRTDDKYAPRTIDLDVVLHGETIITEPDLRLPDPDIRTRAFIAIPLAELAPDLILPDTGELLVELVARFDCSAMTAESGLTRRLRHQLRG